MKAIWEMSGRIFFLLYLGSIYIFGCIAAFCFVSPVVVRVVGFSLCSMSVLMFSASYVHVGACSGLDDCSAACVV